mmetsp:Transcript_31435/g.76704  ORF Transcript_31435/g.76704 Transcript_31435/m.76704 type:complete len:200 (-) Transcript_31435:1938-2537(-)
MAFLSSSFSFRNFSTSLFRRSAPSARSFTSPFSPIFCSIVLRRPFPSAKSFISSSSEMTSSGTSSSSSRKSGELNFFSFSSPPGFRGCHMSSLTLGSKTLWGLLSRLSSSSESYNSSRCTISMLSTSSLNILINSSISVSFIVVSRFKSESSGMTKSGPENNAQLSFPTPKYSSKSSSRLAASLLLRSFSLALLSLSMK